MYMIKMRVRKSMYYLIGRRMFTIP
jgi:hypothetical protein